MGVNESAKDLIGAIKASKEFSELVQAKAQIEKNPSLKREVGDFNRKLGEIYTSNKPINQIEARVSEINKQFATLSKVPEVDRYIKSTKVFNDMVNRVFKSVHESIEAEVKLK